jgi:type IV secretory pathway protease TraF
MNRRELDSIAEVQGGFRIESQSRRRQRLLIGVAGFAAICAVLLPKMAPRLVWNASPSAPIGCYWVKAAGALRIGDMVLAIPSKWAGRLADQRGYLPAGVRS